jgi:hypothetical protein
MPLTVSLSVMQLSPGGSIPALGRQYRYTGMSKKTIQKKIDALFEHDVEAHKDEIKSFVETIQTNYSEAEQLFRRAFMSFLLFWTAFYAIGSGIISEGEIVSLKVSNIKTLLIAGPPVMSALYYFLSASGSAAMYFNGALSQIYKHILPKAYELNLEFMLAPPTIFSVELLLEGQSSYRWLNRIGYAWRFILLHLIFFGAIIPIGHVSYLMMASGTSSWYLRIFSLVIAIILWLRGLFLFITSLESTENI